MDEKGKELGSRFRKIRKARKLTLEQASAGILSPSTLSRWERGKHEISVSVYSQLVDKLHISPRELNSAKINRRDVITQISIYYVKNETDQLKQLGQELLTQYRKTKDFDDLLMAGTACNSYFDLSEEDITDEAFKRDVTIQVKRIKDWHEDNLTLFANLQYMLEPQLIYKTARNLLSKAYEYEIVPTAYARGLSNAIFSLIKLKEPKYAAKLFSTVKILNFSPYDYRIEQNMLFFDKLLNYIQTKDATQVEQYLASLTAESSMKRQAKEDFTFSFDQVKRIYQK